MTDSDYEEDDTNSEKQSDSAEQTNTAAGVVRIVENLKQIWVHRLSEYNKLGLIYRAKILHQCLGIIYDMVYFIITE